MLIKLSMKEHNSPYPNACESEAIIEIDETRLKNDTEICDACQKAYDEYFSTLSEYANEDEALNDGICFGSCFPFISENITKKHGFKIIHVIEYNVDYDRGFKQ